MGRNTSIADFGRFRRGPLTDLAAERREAARHPRAVRTRPDAPEREARLVSGGNQRPQQAQTSEPPLLSTASPGGIYSRLEERGIRLARFLEQVSVRQPTPAELEALQLARGVSLIRLLRTAYATDGRAVEVNEMLLRSDAYELVYEVPAQ
jgi:hypothetical protein